jgi:hypothetical protein
MLQEGLNDVNKIIFRQRNSHRNAQGADGSKNLVATSDSEA